MKKRMFRHVAVASATASLIFTMAAPTFAASNENESASGGRGAKIHRVTNERPVGKVKGTSRGEKRGGRGMNWLGATTAGSFDRSCLKAERTKEADQLKEARTAQETALKAARTARDAAFAQAKTLTDVKAAKAARKAADKEYRAARNDAQKAFRAARQSVHAALVASDSAACPALR